MKSRLALVDCNNFFCSCERVFDPSLMGKPVVVFFFKGHGCLHCAQQVQAFTENHDAFQHRGVRVIGVTSDDVNTLKNALESSPCPFTILSDPQGIAFAK